MKKVLFLSFWLFFLVSSIFSQTLSFHSGWNFYGATENQITMNQFSDSSIYGVIKYIGNGNDFSLNPENWSVWTQDENLMTNLKEAGWKKCDVIYGGESFAIYATGSNEVNISGMCKTNFIPIATVSSDYKNGGYAIYDSGNNTTFKNLNSYPLGGDIRSYFYDGYIFVVDAPNTGGISTWYVYKIDNNAASLNQSEATTPIANYNINRQNPHAIAFASIDKAYLTSYFDNSILIFNPLTGDELGSIDLTQYLYTSDNGTINQYVGAEHMLIYKDKLFVTIDRARKYYGDVQPDNSMILIINLSNNTVEKSIEVNYSPRSPQVYGNYFYFLSMGDYSSPIGKIFRINLSTYKLDNDFVVSSPIKSDNSTDYIKNFLISPNGALYFVANSGWGNPYNVYRILNINLYNDIDKTALETTPVYSSDGYLSDMAYNCNKVIIADRGSEPCIVFISPNGNITKINDSQLGYPPYKIGVDYNY